MDPLSIVLTIVAAILSLVLIGVGVQTILVLQEVRRSLQHFNHFTNVMEDTLTRTFAPLQQLGGMAQGMKAGFVMLESFTHFLRSKTDEKNTK